MIDLERYRRVDEIFQAALELDPDERASYMSQACGGDESLVKEVEYLLASDEQQWELIGTPAFEMVAPLLTRDQPELKAGDSIGHYHIVSLLGVGGMGQVYLAEDHKLGRKVALKLLPASYTRDDSRLRRFQLEARAASALNHPNILTIHELGEVDGQQFIATEFVEGQTLRERMRRAALTAPETIDIAIQIGIALATAHKAGIIHRDIKPENIMLRHDGYVKVLDFGLAKLTEQPEPVTHAHATDNVNMSSGLMMGTVKYMSPEQARGRQVDPRSDIFSFGVVLYEMIAGDTPFNGKDSIELVSAIVKKEPDPLANATDEMQRLVSKALSKKKEDRPQTIEEFLVDLKSLREDQAVKSVGAQTASPKINGSALATSEAELISTATTVEHFVRGIKRHKITTVLTGVILAICAAFFLVRGRMLSAAKPKIAIDSLAVMPFENSSDNPENDFLSEGIAEDVINRLSRLPNLKVFARSTMFTFKGKQSDAVKIGVDLGAGAVLTGRMRQQGELLDLQVELVEIPSGRQLWGEKYLRKTTDLAEVEADLSTHLAGNLGANLEITEAQRLFHEQSASPAAYQLYLKGRYFRNKDTYEGRKKAVEYFLQAIELDPLSAQAYAAMSTAYLINYPPPEKEALMRAKAAALKAIELDSSSAEAHATLGFVMLWADWDFPNAEEHLKKALSLNPNLVSTHHAYAWFLTLMGRFDEALVERKRALDLDPVSALMVNDLGITLYYARHYDQALEPIRKALEMNPRRWRPHKALSEIYIQKGMYEDAVSETQAYLTLFGLRPEPIAEMGEAYKQSGWRGFLQYRLEWEKHPSPPDGFSTSPYQVAVLYLLLGEKSEALDWLRRACDEHEKLLLFIKVDPQFDSLRSDPRFSELLQRVGLKPN